MENAIRPLARPRVSLAVPTAGEPASLRLHVGFGDSPFGRCLVVDCERGICQLSFPASGEDQSPLKEIQRRWPEAEVVGDDARAAAVAARIFHRPAFCRSGETLLVRGTAFQIEVWRALLEVPPGTLASYRHIAAKIGRPRAVRAVGAAVGANRIGWLVPCHRIVPASGGIGNFRWGPACKSAMIAAEWCDGTRHPNASPFRFVQALESQQSFPVVAAEIPAMIGS